MQKSYNCNQCGYSCNRPFMLVIHLLVHSGEKPFVCSWCNYSCTEAGTLKAHMRIEEKALQLQEVRLLLRKGEYSQSTPAQSFRRKTISVHSVHLFFARRDVLKKSNCQLIKGKSISAVTSKKCIFSCRNSSNQNYQMLSHIAL